MKKSTQTSNVLFAGTVMAMLLLFAAVSSAGLAAAQERGEAEEEAEKRKHFRNHTFAIGVGAAIEVDDDHPYRSHLRFALSPVSADDQGSATDFTVKRGVIVINDEGSPVRYHADPESWTVTVNDETEAFGAEGIVLDSEDNEFDVSLRGEPIRETNRGTLYLIKGELSGDGSEYELYYIGIVIKRTAVQPTPAASTEQA